MNWININDQLPPEQDKTEPCNEYILVYGKYGTNFAMYMDGEFYKDYSAKYTEDAVTHWTFIKRPSED